MPMHLTKFRVQCFRSVDDSGWIEANDVTALIGVNESGKSNLLLPLWKLNPAKGGAINPTADYPRKRYGDIRGMDVKPVFIEALFEVEGHALTLLAKKADLDPDAVAQVMVTRRLSGEHEISFPLVPSTNTVAAASVRDLIASASKEIGAMDPMATEKPLAGSIAEAVASALESLPQDERFDLDTVTQALALVTAIETGGSLKGSSIVPRFERLRGELEAVEAELSKPSPSESESVKSLVVKLLPKFVYYSNYGNLDSEIYLPHVIENLKREDLGQRDLAKVRTLKVLFEFVRLQPDEILELGQDLHANGAKPTDAQIDQAAENRKERSILLQSASTKLTERFREWWKQGDYRFRFEADGDHFRIWVADDRRPEEVELEGRSTGLQWFLSFYLVFLVESEDTHSGCILLLDEPGLSLHPLAQRDLSNFFDGLADHNQLLYTTHSPFLVDADRLDRARKVYVAPDGTSKATSNLGADDGDPTKRGAGFAVHAALGLSVAEGLLIGCEPIVVEGPSDQHYLTAIKTLLIANGSLKPGREIVFPPAGGAKGIKAVASILGGRDETLPVALLDSDAQGDTFAQGLRTGLYVDVKERVLQVGDFVQVERAEVEDLIPPEIVIKAVDRMIRTPETAFEEHYQANGAIVPQIKEWATDGGVELEPGWKVELAKRVKNLLLGGADVPAETVGIWQGVFERFQDPASGADS